MIFPSLLCKYFVTARSPVRLCSAAEVMDFMGFIDFMDCDLLCAGISRIVRCGRSYIEVSLDLNSSRT